MIWFARKSIFIDPRFRAFTSWQCNTVISTRIKFTKIKPNASHYVTSIDNIKDKTREGCQIILSFLRVLLQSTAQKQLKRLCKSVHMCHSENFQPVVTHWFSHNQLRNCTSHIKEEIPKDVVLGNAFDLLVSSSFLEHVQADLHQVNDINYQFNSIKCWLYYFV